MKNLQTTRSTNVRIQNIHTKRHCELPVCPKLSSSKTYQHGREITGIGWRKMRKCKPWEVLSTMTYWSILRVPQMCKNSKILSLDIFQLKGLRQNLRLGSWLNDRNGNLFWYFMRRGSFDTNFSMSGFEVVTIATVTPVPSAALCFTDIL